MADSTDRTVLVHLDTPAQGLRSPALELLTMARGLGSVVAVALEEPSEGTLDQLAEHGVRELLVTELCGAPGADPHLTPVAAEALAAAVAASGATVVLLSSSFPTKEAAARLAHATGGGLVLDVTEVSVDGDGAVVGAKRVLAGTWDVACAVRSEPAVLTVRANAVVATPAPARSEVAVRRVAVEVTATATAARLVSRTEHEPAGGGSGRPALAEAAYVVAGGRGTLGDFGPVEDLADALGAAVGATRDAVDEGWVGHDAQIGQTGVTVAPRLYVGAGISGAPHHRGGMQSSAVIVAVNNDPDSPIFEIADFGVVGDLAEVLPQAAATIRAHRA
ncbi:electron transfer flavoprotein subunit alpha/FixB family protein [Sanguibacter suaedae]|uniref:Electron transfer flavoprotein subunit alpha/FixB family protein n=1 Tax=Sanguibacter suaedae TaxID=2795737 RepID=A0A934IE48_9MICO|nr:electron transfer flavoprotein subunit alpha/FixB family protein [Sanguibacter suaedae]MBI9116070.1 electron transfer flavoprotein subunit alpha/FixB family protein [Sanguibacter suaedae]